MNKIRCQWVRKGIHQRHHDAEWGVPLHDDRKLFEFLLLDGGHRRGLSWATILYRRPAYRKAFERFSPDKISRYTKSDVDSILKNHGIIRN